MLEHKEHFLEVGAWNTMGFAALEAGLDLIARLGIPSIFDHVQGIHDAIEGPMQELGFTSLRATDPAARSGTLSFKPPPGVDITQMEGALLERSVALSIPDGCLRISPHWPNSRDQAAQIVAACASVATDARQRG